MHMSILGELVALGTRWAFQRCDDSILSRFKTQGRDGPKWRLVPNMSRSEKLHAPCELAAGNEPVISHSVGSPELCPIRM